MLQLDVSTCLKAGSDPTAWIRANPGRIRSLHLKDWSSDPTKGYRVLFGDGDANWKQILDAAKALVAPNTSCGGAALKEPVQFDFRVGQSRVAVHIRSGSLQPAQGTKAASIGDSSA